MRLLILLFALVMTTALTAQEYPNNWWDLDRTDDSYPGVSAAKAHAYLAGKEAREVVVAVIDSGVDIEHEDLKDIIWTNPGEVPGNGIDDDGNGYVDDVHGWNFIGGKDGRNINQENLEVVRLYNRFHKKYNNRNRDGLNKAERAEYDAYIEYKEQIEKRRADLEPNLVRFLPVEKAVTYLEENTDKPLEEVTKEDIAALDQSNPNVQTLNLLMQSVEAQGSTLAELSEQVMGALEYYRGQLDYNYNPDFDAREIVGDNPGDLNDRDYGNPDVMGPDAAHGTHVAGIIAAVRDNNLGVNGVGGPMVRIMSVRAVPNGDERDKDVANAIRYAVDNGASIINMSFGKGQSPYKKAVDEAMKYAEKNDVLLVHAAGNDGKLLSLKNNFPNDTYEGKKKTGKTWIEVGAASANYDKKLAASFSNYNKSYVDVFAPGRGIYSTIPGSEYASFNGTSMAAPMVAGIAALLRSYFPDLKATQVRDIILESALPVNFQVYKPGSKPEDEELINFSDLSATGGLANAYTAVKLAERTKGKLRKMRDLRDDALANY